MREGENWRRMVLFGLKSNPGYARASKQRLLMRGGAIQQKGYAREILEIQEGIMPALLC